jgi:HD-GYP domain-containing protein (c-di-GMP phosphodiesterase class II)
MAETPIPDDARDAEAAREAAYGLEVVFRLHGLLRAGRLYAPTHQTFERHVQEMISIFESNADDETALVGMGETFYVNGARIRPQASQYPLFQALLSEFESRALGAVRFMKGMTADEVKTFVQIFTAARTPAHAEQIPEAVSEAGVSHIVPVRMRDLRTSQLAPVEEQQPLERSERARARQTFWRAVVGTRNILLRASQTGRPALRQAKRLVQPIVDSIMKNEYSIMGLAALRSHDEYTFAHCVNVSVLSVRMGQVLGLSRAALANLGVAALLHDLGKLSIATDVLQKPGQLDDGEWEQVRRHPLIGALMISRMPGLSPLTLDAMRVSLQHHMNIDHTGYPEIERPAALATFSRIVAVADFFDAITAHRAYRARPYTGFEALRHMMGPDRSHFDPAVLWALVQGIGLYPAGSVLRTSSGYLALSTAPNPQDLRRPVCRVLSRPDGESLLDSNEMWSPMPPSESVAHVLEPGEHPFDVNELLAA